MNFFFSRWTIALLLAVEISIATAQKKMDPALLAKAKAGDPQAQLAIGEAYASGILVAAQSPYTLRFYTSQSIYVEKRGMNEEDGEI